MEQPAECANVEMSFTETTANILAENPKVSRVEMDNIHISSDDEPMNEWDQTNTKTINKWRKGVEITSFVYNDVLDQYTVAIQRVLILIIIFGALITVISGINVALGTITTINSVWIVFGLNVAIFLCGAGITISTGLIKLNSWDDKIRSYAEYVERLSGLWIILKSELDMSAEYRIQAGDFIKRMHGQYINLIHQGPQISWKEDRKSVV